MKRRLKIVFIILVIAIQIPLMILVWNNEKKAFESTSFVQASQVEENVNDTRDFIEYMEILSGDYFSKEFVAPSEQYSELTYSEENNTYYVGGPDQKYENFNGTIVGEGPIPTDEAIINELEFVFELNEYFVKFYQKNENISRVYYISESNFLSVYPPVAPSDISTPLNYYDKEYYVNALPENNPTHKPVWSSVYSDALGEGEIITLSIPIYNGDDFIGVLGIDRSVEDIKALFRANYDTYLYEKNGTLVASNTTISENAVGNSILTNTQLSEIATNAVAYDSYTFRLVEGYIYTEPIDNTEWVYISIVPTGELLLNSFIKTTPIMVGAVVLIVIYYNGQRKREQQLLVDENNLLEDEITKRIKEVQLTQEVTIDAVSALTESRDNETGYHIFRTKLYTQILAESLATTDKYKEYMTPEIVKNIYISAPLHDIGKVGISDAVLQKPGKLTDEEFEIMKQHTIIGANALIRAASKLGSNSFLDSAIEMAQSHHEKYDGTGYPNGLKAEEIPISARIMALADVYDALRSKRVYKDAFSHDKSMDIIVSESGSAFDPDVVEEFIKNSEMFAQISESFAD